MTPNDTPLTIAAEPEFHTVTDTAFGKLINQAKLSNRENADVCRVLARRQIELNKNQMVVDGKMKVIAEGLSRLENLILDHQGEGGRIRPGLARSLQATQKQMHTIESKITEVFLSNQTLRRLIPWLIKEVKERGGEVTDEVVAKAYEAIQAKLVEEGEAAVAHWSKIEEIGSRSANCAGCVFWKEAPLVIVPGEVATAGCENKFVQVMCAQCGDLHGPPVDPNAVKGECKKCQIPLMREIEVQEEGLKTLCKGFTPNREKLRAKLVKAGIPQNLIDQVAPIRPAVEG
jgi:hypothetical protein